MMPDARAQRGSAAVHDPRRHRTATTRDAQMLPVGGMSRTPAPVTETNRQPRRAGGTLPRGLDLSLVTAADRYRLDGPTV